MLQCTGSLIAALGLNCSMHVNLYFPDQELNPCPLDFKVDFRPLDHHGTPWAWARCPRGPLPEAPSLRGPRPSMLCCFPPELRDCGRRDAEAPGPGSRSVRLATCAPRSPRANPSGGRAPTPHNFLKKYNFKDC